MSDLAISSRLRRAALVVLLGFGAAAAAVAAPVAALAQTPASTLRVVQTSLVRIFDPHFTTSFYTRDFGYLVFDTLLAVNDRFEPQPQMVDRWEISPDTLTYTFHLRDGLTWHDGSPVKAEDCIASIKRWGSRDGLGQALLGFTKEMVEVDDRTFKIVLREPFGLVLQSLGKVGSLVPFMLPKRLAEKPASEQIAEIIGSGPYRYRPDLSQSGIRVVLDKFADYVPRKEPPNWGSGAKIARIDRVELVSIPDTLTAVNALNAGEVDYIDWLPFDLLPLVERSRTARGETMNRLGTIAIMRFNFLYPPFDDPKVRQAVSLAFNQEDYLRAYVGNPKYYKTCMSLYMCGTPYETSAGAPERDLARARQLIKESGVDLSKPIVFLHVTDTASVKIPSLVTAEMLKSLGFKVDLQGMDFTTFAMRRMKKDEPEKGGWNVFHTNWTAPDVVDPIVSLSLNASGDSAWWGWPKDDRIETLRSAFSRETDPAKRKALTEEISRIAYEDVLFLNLGQFQHVSGLSNRISGALEAPVMLLYNIGKK